MPRSTHGDNIIDMTDVLPLRDVRRTLLSSDPGASFECFPPVSGGSNPLQGASAPPQQYPFPTRGTGFNYMNQIPANSHPAYICAWNPNTYEPLPSLIRITVGIDDAAGRLGDAQTFEYVINLQP